MGEEGKVEGGHTVHCVNGAEETGGKKNPSSDEESAIAPISALFPHPSGRGTKAFRKPAKGTKWPRGP